MVFFVTEKIPIHLRGDSENISTVPVKKMCKNERWTGGTSMKEQLEKGVKANSEIDREKNQIKEVDAEITEIMGALSDPVTGAIFWRIAETGACAKKDLETLDAVVKEGETFVQKLREYGLIDIGDGGITLTETGRKLLEYLESEDNNEEVGP